VFGRDDLEDHRLGVRAAVLELNAGLLGGTVESVLDRRARCTFGCDCALAALADRQTA
jgi:hypothetical protein